MRRLLALFCTFAFLMVPGCASVSKKSASDTALEAIRENKASEGTIDVWYLDYTGDTLSNAVLLEYKSLSASAVSSMPAVEFNPRAFATGEELADAALYVDARESE